MNAVEAFLAELELEAATTRRVLEAVPEDSYGWRPHEKAMSMSELCDHMASLLTNMPSVLGGESFDFAQRPSPGEPPVNREEVLARFNGGVSATQEWLGGLGDSLSATWTLMYGEREVMAMPRVVAIRSLIFNHLYHHRGQLSTYLRASGAKVPSVYGPTADVAPFAEA